MTKEEKYDAIVAAWNKNLEEDRNEVWYLLAGSGLAEAIQELIQDDITQVITVK